VTGVDAQAVLDKMVKRIIEQFEPEKIILFGSFAKGVFGADSDLDILVVMDVHGSVRGITNQIDIALADRVLPLDLVVVTPSQFEREQLIPGTIVREAVRGGKILYDRAA
jgi:predicted nucleotidyltransferase